MSLILEALKKSEAERRLGRAPGLLDSQPLARRRRGGRWRMVLLLITALGMLIGGYWLGQRGSGEGITAAPLASGDRPAPATEAAREEVAEDETLPELDLGRPVAPPQIPTAPATRLPSDPGFRSVERESVPQHAQALPPPAPPAVSAPSPAPPPATATTVPAIEAAPAVEVEPTQSAPPTARLEPDRLLPPTLAQLPAAQREGLPPLRMSMHVYTEDPSTRVVIIDGRRLREGEAIAPGLELREIGRDGSVLDYRGLQFRLPRP